MREAVEDQECSLTLEQLFQVRRQEIFFPLTNNLLRTIPEESLQGVAVYSSEGELLGEFSNTVPYHRSGGLYAVRGDTRCTISNTRMRRAASTPAARIYCWTTFC